MKPESIFGLDTAGWPALLLDGAGTICRANAAAVALFGSVLEGTAPLLAAIWSPENPVPAEKFLAQWERAPVASAVLKFRVRGGTTLTQTVFICALTRESQKHFILQCQPETGREGADGRNPDGAAGLAHKQKLDCALQLARTVALDFNNALTTILGHSSLLLSQMEPHHPWRASLLEVEKSAAKAAEIANDLGAFSRQDKEPRGQPAGNLNLLLKRTVEFFQQSGGSEQVEWELLLEPRLFAAKFDEAKMQQVFMRIFENALQSFTGAGRIKLETRNLGLKAPTQDKNITLTAGAYVCAEISDTGSGIGPEVLPRVFEPFFTTKKGHRGLGLAWVYGIVTNHAGSVAISSEPGHGASVRVYLPAENRVVKDNGLLASDLTGKQTVLIVDDEDMLLTMGQTILSAYGYHVLTANSGQKAIELLSAKDPAVDLVITDLIMPGMSGRELVDHVRHTSPGLPILCTSGYVWPASQVKELPYLQKPFTAQDLLLSVKQALSD